MPTISHAYRASLLGKLLTFTLTSRALKWRSEEGAGEIPLDRIGQVRLNRVPGLGPDTKLCELRMVDGPRVLLKSAHYKSFGSFEDRSETYTAMVQALLPRIVKASPEAKIFYGNSFLWWVWTILFVLCSLIVAMMGFALLSGEAIAVPGLIAIGVVIAAMPMLWRGIRRGRRREVGLGDLPEDLL